MRHPTRDDDYETALPARVRTLVRRRREALATRVEGDRILDLGGASAHHQLWPGRAGRERREPATVLTGPDDEELGALAGGNRHFDTVVSVMALSRSSDRAATVARIRDVLSPEGELWFVELGTPRWHRRRAASQPDIPMVLRAVGLSVTHLDRHRVRTFGVPSTWAVVEGRAHHALEPARPRDT